MDRGREFQPRGEERSVSERGALRDIFGILLAAFGVDFSEYQARSFNRQVAGRMVSQGAVTVADYAALLRDDPLEVRVLYERALLHVTSFFRNPRVFDTLAREILPAIRDGKRVDGGIRVWVAGCATGEEVYSLAILFLESLGSDSRRVQIVGTDVSRAVIAKARLGVYADSALETVSADRRERYFVRTPDGHRVNQTVQDLCSFLEHDLARDQPLAHVDLLSCRNVTMYFEPGLRARVFERFHYALEQPGFLLLGPAEDVSGAQHLFSSVNGNSRVFVSKSPASTLHFPEPVEAGASEHREDAPDAAADAPRRPWLGRCLDRTLLAHYVPPGVLINEQMQILEFRGHTGAYLELAPGAPTDDIMAMLRPGLRAALLAAIRRAQDQAGPVRVVDVKVDGEDGASTCDVVVSHFPGLPGSGERLLTVMFERCEPGERALSPDGGPTARALRSTNRHLACANVELQRINDDLRHRLAEALETLASTVG